jgi:hypothetical protein
VIGGAAAPVIAGIEEKPPMVSRNTPKMTERL